MCLISGWCFCNGVLILLIRRPSPRGHWRDDIRTRRSCRFDRRVHIYPNPNAATRPCQGGDRRRTIRTGSLHSNNTRTWSSSCLFHVDAHYNRYEQKEGWHGYPPIMHVRSAGAGMHGHPPISGCRLADGFRRIFYTFWCYISNAFQNFLTFRPLSEGPRRG